MNDINRSIPEDVREYRDQLVAEIERIRNRNHIQKLEQRLDIVLDIMQQSIALSDTKSTSNQVRIQKLENRLVNVCLLNTKLIEVVNNIADLQEAIYQEIVE